MSEDRLDRIEQKLDKLTEVIVVIARVEEKMAANNSRLENLEKRAEKNEEVVSDLKDTVRNNTGVAKFADKSFWIVVGLVGSVVAWVLKNNTGV